jgi:predicted O-methyltransferase YrrM
MDETDRLLSRVKERARGWMPLSVYRQLYDSAAACGGGTIVEIGTFCGAATIVMALGARLVGEPFQIVTADLLRPGVGLRGTTPSEKIAALGTTLVEFGVHDDVLFVQGDTCSLVAAAEPREIRLLLLDGGGRLETDLALLWDRLAADAVIVIDDIDGSVTVARSRGMAEINQKHRISKLLTDLFVERAMLVPTGRTGSTGWYRKGEASPSAEAIRLMALPAYHELIRARVASNEFSMSRTIARSFLARAPCLRRLYRRLQGAR